MSSIFGWQGAAAGWGSAAGDWLVSAKFVFRAKVIDSFGWRDFRSISWSCRRPAGPTALDQKSSAVAEGRDKKFGSATPCWLKVREIHPSISQERAEENTSATNKNCSSICQLIGNVAVKFVNEDHCIAATIRTESARSDLWNHYCLIILANISSFSKANTKSYWWWRNCLYANVY